MVEKINKQEQGSFGWDNGRKTTIKLIVQPLDIESMRQKQVWEPTRGIEAKLRLLKTLQQTNQPLTMKFEARMDSFCLETQEKWSNGAKETHEVTV